MGSWVDRTMRAQASSSDWSSIMSGRYLGRGTRAQQRRRKSRKSGRHLVVRSAQVKGRRTKGCGGVGELTCTGGENDGADTARSYGTARAR